MIERPDLAAITIAALVLGAAALPVVRTFAPGRRWSWPIRTIVAAQTALSWGIACLLPPPWAYLGLILAWCLLVLALVDYLELRLPDRLTLPLTGLGLLTSLTIDGGDPVASGLGAVAGYGIFTLIAWLYRRLRGLDGLGQGDAKLLAACGAWLGWPGLAPVVLTASLLALAVLLVHRFVTHRPIAPHEAFPFGPFLCGGFWLVWVLG
ncbi:prepilin peptidase [Magnetospirillum fulvum]|uniref:Leader peptidase (Prepilin peptidase) / N-methyltransferase n=1 Tax=Magnetospirillum fulvum TaxID=1082 RepID=A0A1H6ILG8_MAGFU|nr:A24 family peptidase [Magnetospirillum fulvum]SEH48245.1 leader peptidase (prepilin peptidase) / N-methyltransferase [Magnetospirillum fulvum]